MHTTDEELWASREDLLEQYGIADDQEPDAGEVRDRSVTEMAEEMIALKEELEELDARKKQVQARFDQLRKVDIPEKMQAMGMVDARGKGSFTVGGARLSLRTDLYPNVRKENQEAFFAHLRESGEGDLIKESVHPQTLKAWVKDKIAGGQAVPEHVTTYEETSVTLTRSRK